MKILKKTGIVMLFFFSINLNSQNEIDYNKVAKLIFDKPGKLSTVNLKLLIEYYKKEDEVKQLLSTQKRINYYNKNFSKKQVSRSKSKRERYNSLVLKKRRLQKYFFKLYKNADHDKIYREHNKDALKKALGS